MATKKAAGASALAGAVKGRSAGGSKPSGWGARGWEVAGKEIARQDKQRAEASNATRRFWLKDGEEARIIFVDGVPFSFREHIFQEGQTWGNEKTCLQGFSEKGCPACRAGNKSYFVSMFTVIDMREWKGKDGKVYKNQIRLFPAKAEAMKLLDKIRQKRGDLAGIMFDVSRNGEKSSRVGNMFDFVKKVDLKDPKIWKGLLGLKEAPKSIPYEEKLAPMGYAEMGEWMGTSGSSGGGDEAVGY